MITWRPDTEPPTQRTTALICRSVGSLTPPAGNPMLCAELYTWTAPDGWRGELSGLVPFGRFWWLPESEVIGEPLREATRFGLVSERIVLPVVMAFGLGVLAMDVASEGQKLQRLEDMRVAVTRQLKLEQSPVFCPTYAEVKP